MNVSELPLEGPQSLHPAGHFAIGTLYLSAATASATLVLFAGLSTVFLKTLYFTWAPSKIIEWIEIEVPKERQKTVHDLILAATLPLFVLSEGLAISIGIKGLEGTHHFLSKTFAHFQNKG